MADGSRHGAEPERDSDALASVSLVAEAKLAVPSLRHGVVDRPRVRRAPDAGRGVSLTLVAAPVGYGKTTEVRARCASWGAALTWVTLPMPAIRIRCAPEIHQRHESTRPPHWARARWRRWAVGASQTRLEATRSPPLERGLDTLPRSARANQSPSAIPPSGGALGRSRLFAAVVRREHGPRRRRQRGDGGRRPPDSCPWP
jgi:hypothetical protein